MWWKAEVGVQPVDPVVAGLAAHGIAKHHDPADVGAPQDVLADPQHAIIVAGHPAEVIGPHPHSAHHEPGGLTREAGAPHDGDLPAVVADADASAEEEEEVLVRRGRQAHPGVAGGVAHVEDARVLEEELPLLLVEETELGEVHPLLVHLHLSEVGIGGDVQGEPLGETVFGVEPHLGVVVEGVPAGLTDGARQGERLDSQVPTGGRPGESVQVSSQGEPIERVRPGDGRPVRDLVLAPEQPSEVDAPGARLGFEA